MGRDRDLEGSERGGEGRKRGGRGDDWVGNTRVQQKIKRRLGGKKEERKTGRPGDESIQQMLQHIQRS